MILDAVADWQELSALYEQADLLDDTERAAWLARLKAEKHRLLPQVERMLSARAHLGSNAFLEALPLLEPPDEPAPSEWGEGSRIGAYRLVRHLGSGGMAEVWLADRVDGAFERQVAIKLLFDHPSRARRETFVERFRRERDILASLDHPNIARLHDAGVTPSGQPWLALEYVEGHSIVQWCNQRKLPVAARVTLFKQVLDAVAHAHRHLIVHRDLKPANILVSHEGTVHLLDFGIAKLLDSPDGTSQDTELTRSAGRLMTLQYASPEQVLGEPLSTASDLYSAAAVLYELVCGARVHGDDRRNAIGLQQAILEAPARSPRRVATDEAAQHRGERNAASLRKTIGRDLDAVLLLALEKSPSRRYPSMDGLGADLDRWQRGLPTAARPVSAPERAFKFIRRHPVAVSLGLGSVVGLVATTAVAVVMSLSAQREAKRALAARDFLLQIFQDQDPDRSKGREARVTELLHRGRLKAESTLANELKLQAELLAAIGTLQASLGDRVDAEKSFDAAVDRFTRQGLQHEAAQTLVAAVANLVSQGKYAQGAATLERVEAAVRNVRLDDELQARLYDMKGTVAWQTGKLPQAVQFFSTALEFARTGFPPADPRNIDILTSLAEVEAELKAMPLARQYSTEALRRGQAIAASAPSAMLQAATAVAKVNVLDGRLPEAIDVLAESLPVCERSLGEDADPCGVIRVRLALLCIRIERIAQAERYLPMLLRRAAQEGSPRRQADAMVTAIRVLGAAGADTTLHPLYATVRQLATSTTPSGDTASRALARLALAEAEVRRGRSSAVLESSGPAALVESADVLTGAGAYVLDLAARTRLLRGLALMQQGRSEQALVALRAAHDALVTHHGRDHPFSILVQLNQVIALCASGQEAMALELARSSLSSLEAKFSSSEPILARWRDVAVRTGDGRRMCDRSPSPYLF